ncbi:YtxH domain-containing protein [Glycomyces arizonensis]|uniref:YtxH domain-containing protein n=1 Tax=Glycomyces arizonensis TaxID=256035 RepID=UPI00041C05EC|nr:YtxH domain-containing protein [Glycomyces arizonensis]
MRKWYFVAGLGIGYILGAKAGRERYEQIMNWTREVTGNDKVQHVASTVRDQAGRAKDAAQDKIKGTKFGDIVEGFSSNGPEHPRAEPWDSAGVTTPTRSDREIREDAPGF